MSSITATSHQQPNVQGLFVQFLAFTAFLKPISHERPGKATSHGEVGRYPILRCPVEDIGAGKKKYEICHFLVMISLSLSL